MAMSVPVPMAMPKIRLGQRGRIVDAVADERHAPSLLLQQPHLLRLLLRQHLGEHLIDADLLGDGLSGLAVVAGDHHRLQALGTQPLDCRLGVLFQRVGNGDEADQLVVPGDGDNGLCGGFALLDLALKAGH